jgi:hypothetical protein
MRPGGTIYELLPTRLRTAAVTCGRAARVIATVETKMEDRVVGRDGQVMSPSSLTHPFKPIPPLAIIESQIVQERDGEIDVRVVPGPAYSADSTGQLIERFERRFGDALKVHLTLVDSVDRTPAGNLRWVVRITAENMR